MNLQKPFIVIALTALITTFTLTSFARDDHDDDGKFRAKKDTGGTILSHVPGCTIKIIDSDNVILYTDRTLQGIPIAKVPVGNYQPVDYTIGWYKIRARGWIAWIKDPTITGVNGVINSVLHKSNCPGKNTASSKDK